MNAPDDEQDLVREAAAFRAALRREAESFEPAEIRAPRPVRRRWPALLGAAASVVIVAGLGWGAITLGGHGGRSSTADSGTVSADKAAPGARPELQQAPAAGGPGSCERTIPLGPHDRVQPRHPGRSPLEGRVDSLSICQYATASGALTGSRRLVGGPAGRLVQAIREAPVGAGPLAPLKCPVGAVTPSYVVLRIAGTIPGDVYVTYAGCTPNGFTDGHTVRRLTAASCRPVFAEAPIRLGSVPSAVKAVCGA